MWNNKKVSVILPAYNEEQSVYKIAKEYTNHPYVDEVLVINNNSTDQTAKEAKRAGAKVIDEPRQGYGFALQRGLKETSGDFIILSESDGNFYAKDILKLLAYTDEYEYVKGTRIRRELYDPGMMSPLMRDLLNAGNIAVAKLTQALFYGPSLTDAGCTMRLISRPALKKILPYLSVGGGHFLAEMNVLAILAKLKIIEVPVRFGKRIGGQAKHSSGIFSLSKIALKMIGVIFKYRLLSLKPNYFHFD